MSMDDTGTIPADVAEQLLALARASIESGLSDGALPRAASDNPILNEPRGAFVTLKKRGVLRGCIGRIEAEWPLWETVARMARAAAFDDPRFPRLGNDELEDIELEVSVMSPLTRVGSPEEVVAGEHGVLLDVGGRRAVFLPQVAADNGWNRETLLDQLCYKAGLPEKAWRNPAARIEVFHADVIEE